MVNWLVWRNGFNISALFLSIKINKRPLMIVSCFVLFSVGRFCAFGRKTYRMGFGYLYSWVHTTDTHTQAKMILSKSYQFTVMVLTISTIFHIVQVVAGLFAQQTTCLSACDVKLLLTPWSIALHTCAYGRFWSFVILLTNVAHWKMIGRKKFD